VPIDLSIDVLRPVDYDHGAVALKTLPKAVQEPETEIAQRFLTSAYESVNGVLETLATVRKVRSEKAGKKLKGRLTLPEEDLLRAAVVFTGAGLDATLKQLIRDSLPRLLESNAQAHDKFERFAADELGTGEIADTRAIARYLTSPDPRSRLIEDYVYDLTGSSLQSADQVQTTAGALGIDDSSLRTQIGGLRTLFVARNEISHELDLQELSRPGDRTRRSRAMQETETLCGDGFTVGQLVVNAVGNLLNPP
jgi:hypothetical protein